MTGFRMTKPESQKVGMDEVQNGLRDLLCAARRLKDLSDNDTTYDHDANALHRAAKACGHQICHIRKGKPACHAQQQ